MHNANLLASRLIKALGESIETNTAQLIEGVEDFSQYRHVQGSTLTMVEMKKIGVILCSKSKKDYACEVAEMYSKSILFSSQQAFMDAVYDDEEQFDNYTSQISTILHH